MRHLILLATALATASAAEIHVAPGGNDSAAGTPTAPIATLARAAQLAQAGDTVRLHDGTWRETWTPQRSGTPTAPITLAAWGSARPVISALNIVTPGQGGAGAWQDRGGGLWSIQLASGQGMGAAHPGASLVLLAGRPVLEARWPDLARPVDPSRDSMALSSGGGHDPASGSTQTTYSITGVQYSGWYTHPWVAAVPAGGLDKALIDLCPGAAWWARGGVVTGNSGSRVDFRWIYNMPGIDLPGAGDRFAVSGRLVCCDGANEAFLDVQGLDGPANVLYLRTPDGGSPVGRTLEVRSRDLTASLWGRAWQTMQDITCIGGGINANQAGTVLRGLDISLVMNHNTLDWGTSPALYAQDDGTGCQLIDSTLTAMRGSTVSLNGNAATAGAWLVANNVISNIYGYCISAEPWRGTEIRENTIFDISGGMVGINIPQGRIHHNLAWRGGQRDVDIGLFGMCGPADAGGVEVAWNIIGDHRSLWDPAGPYNGGALIRFDTSCSNYSIHHNICWGGTGDDDIQAWGIQNGAPNQGRANGLIANNTVGKRIRIVGNLGAGDQAGGITVRNNICQSVFSDIPGAVIERNLSTMAFFDNGASSDGEPGLAAPWSNNGQLAGGSAAIDAGAVISGVTDGHRGSAPDLGACESGGVAWWAGAKLRARDLAAVTVTAERTVSGEARLRLGGLAGQRLPATSFRIRLDGGAALPVLPSMDFTNAVSSAVAVLPAVPAAGVHTCDISLDGGSWVAVAGGVTVSAPRLANPPTLSSSGGETVTVSGAGLWGSPTWLLPTTMRKGLPGELEREPLPVRFDGASVTAQGRMQGDGRDLRVRRGHAASVCDGWLESGAATANTLAWAQSPTGSGWSLDPADGLWLSVGDPAATANGSRAWLRAAFPALARSDLTLWYAATAAGEGLAEGAAITNIADLSGSGYTVAAPSASAPRLALGTMNGLPSLRFTGTQRIEVPGAMGPGEIQLFVMYTNPNPTANGGSIWQRLVSTTADPNYYDWAGDAWRLEVPADGAGNALPQIQPTYAEYTSWGHQSVRRSPMRIGTRTIPGDGSSLRGEIGEVLMWSSYNSRWNDARYYLMRKYLRSAWLTTSGAAAIPPVTLRVNGRPARLLSISAAGISFVNPGLLAGETTATLSLSLPDGSTVTTSPANGATLLNGSFETPAVNGYAYNPSGASWTFLNGSAIQANASAWQAAAAPDGIQTAVLQGSPGNLGAIEQTVSLSAGTYTLRFAAARRHGQVQPVRFSVDGTQIGALITPASAAFATYVSSAFTVAAGNRTLRLAATDGSDDRSTFIDQVTLVSGAAAGGSGLTATYFADTTLSAAASTRTDATIDFDWGASAPLSGVGADRFSVRWSGQVQAQFSETYTFTTMSDDGVRLWVNGQQLIDNWTDHAPTANSGTIALVAGQRYDLRMEYYENGGGATARLSWSSPSTALQIIPSAQLHPSSGAPGGIPAGWTVQDIGAVGAAGSTTQQDGVWTLSGSGADIWNNADEFQFAWRQVSGDVRVTARVTGMTNTNPWAKAGVMVRESLASGSRHASTFATASNGVCFQRRYTTDAASGHTAGPASAAPVWVRIERIGSTLTGSTSPDGSTWTVIRSETVSMGAAVHVGLALTSHNDGQLCTATFSDVQVVTAAAAAN